MTQLLFIFTFLIIAEALNAQTVNDNFDSTLAKSLKADDYGMKSYIFVILKTGSNPTTDKNVIDTIFAGHMNNINRLAENGSLLLAGPFRKNDNKYRGLFIFNVESIDEAKQLLETDPAVKGKFLEPEMYQWYGTASLQEILKMHEKIAKYKF